MLLNIGKTVKPLNNDRVFLVSCDVYNSRTSNKSPTETNKYFFSSPKQLNGKKLGQFSAKFKDHLVEENTLTSCSSEKKEKKQK